MNRMAMCACLMVFLLAVPVTLWAQSNSTTDPNAVSSSGGTPGSWVESAIARHQTLIGQRVNAARAGERPGVQPDTSTSSGSSSSSSSGLGSLGSLLNLAGLGSLTGTSSTGTSSTGTSSTGSTNYSLADLLALANGTSKPLNNQVVAADTATKSSTSQTTSDTRVGGAAINRLPKADERYQQATTTDTKFTTRWANSVLGSVFSALTFGLQSTSFITALKDALRPLVLPTTTDTNNNGGTTNNNSSGSTTNGIEDINAPSGNTDTGSSTI